MCICTDCTMSLLRLREGGTRYLVDADVTHVTEDHLVAVFTFRLSQTQDKTAQDVHHGTDL